MTLFQVEKYKENTVAQLVSAFKDLLEIREAAVGHLMEETNEDIERLKDVKRRYSSLNLDSSIKRSKMHDSFIKAFRKDFLTSIQEVLWKISTVTRTYTTQTHRREQYGLIPPIAFSTADEMPWYLGDTNVTCNFDLVWTVQFEQFFLGSSSTGVLEVLGISYPGLTYWWTGRLGGETQESIVWEDMRNLAHKMVYLLDKTNKIDNEWFSLPAVLIHDWESQTRIDEIIVPTLMIICQGLYRLLFRHQEDYMKILPFFENLIPAVYAFCHTLRMSTGDWEEMGEAATKVIEHYVGVLIADYEALIVRLGAEDEVVEYDRTSLDNIKRSLQTGRSSSQDAGDTSQEDITTLRNKTVQYMKTLGIRELNIALEQDNDIGCGSYARVYKCREHNGSRTLAVKFLNFDHSNPGRIANRLLREAACWNKLRHASINMLHGFCIDPINQLPGLVSDYCKFSLANYLDSLENSPKKTNEHLTLLYEVSSGLEHMHQHKEKIAHGDVRPENILLIPRRLGSGYSALLSDFGVSYVDEVLTGIGLTSRQCTNYFYIAPELLSEECKTKKRMVSTQGDIYAFGCVFLRVMYDLMPFYQENRHVIGAKRMLNPLILPALKKHVRGKHWGFLERTWSLRPSDRPKADEVVVKMDMFRLSAKKKC